MGLGFNPSSNKYTDMLMQMVSQMAMKEWEQKRQLDQLKKMSEAVGADEPAYGYSDPTGPVKTPYGQSNYPSGYSDMAGTKDVTALKAPPLRPKLTASGVGMAEVDPKKWMFQQIQDKESKGIALTAEEKALKDSALGIKRPEVKAAQSTVEKFRDKAAGKGWQIKVNKNLPPERQAEVARLGFTELVRRGKAKETDAKTASVIQNIETAMVDDKTALDRFISQKELYQAQGIDVDKILEYFNR